MSSKDSVSAIDQEWGRDPHRDEGKSGPKTIGHDVFMYVGFISAIVVAFCLCMVMYEAIHPDDLKCPQNCSCQYALGGGAVTPGGSFPQAQTTSITCASQLHSYLVNQYDKDVRTAVASARAYFEAYPRQPNASQVIVLDIDETALSNRAEWADYLVSRLQGLNVPFHKDHTLVEADVAPALQPMLDLYTDLYRRGFSVTFITGRRDYGLGRDTTARNLEKVGYGVACAEQPEEEQRAERAQRAPCYVALGMRSEGDQRLASVYKPGQRTQLQERGYEIVASFGDQWSDLAGTSAAEANFKLPNPFYYIL